MPPSAPPRSRVLALEGGQNFRDLGGYPTIDGRTVRWGQLYRSGSMHFLSPRDASLLATLGIRTVCDFRDNGERASEPSDWLRGTISRILAEDYHLSLGGIGKTVPGKTPTVEEARTALAGLYETLLQTFRVQYRRLFGELLAGHAPLLFHCTAGKDRTGIAAALVLSALDVPRETIVADYVLTNRHFDPRRVVAANHQASRDWHKLPPEVLDAYMAAHPSYIARVFEVMDAHNGGVAGFLRDNYGLGADETASLRRLHTEMPDMPGRGH